MKLRALLLSAFFFSGFAALVYEVMFTKGLILFVGGTVFAYSLILTAFLTGMGFGSLLAKRFQETDLATLFAYVQLGIGAYGLLFVPILNNLDVAYLEIYNISHGSFVAFHSLLLLLSYLVLLVPTLLMGMTFPVVSRSITRTEKIGADVGRLFSVNTLGGVAGAFRGRFRSAAGNRPGKSDPCGRRTQPRHLCRGFHCCRPRAAGSPTVSPSPSCFFLRRLCSTQKVDPYRSGVYHQHGRFENRSEYRQALERERGAAAISFSDYGLYGSVVVKEEGPVKVLMINGKVDAGTGLDVPTELLLGYIPTLMHPDPKDVAIIGLGSGITLAAVESFPVERIDVLELNPTVVEAAELFEPENRNALDDERVELTVGDARDYLSTTDRTYDIVISEPSNPWIEGEVFLFTREFYSVVGERLNEGGLFLQWIGAYDFNPEDLKISLRTLETAFPHVQAWADAKGVDFFLLASKGPIVRDYEGIAAAMQDPVIRVRHRGYLRLVGPSAVYRPGRPLLVLRCGR